MKLKNLFSMSSRRSTVGRLGSDILEFQAQYRMKGVLGKGGFGVVHSGVRKNDGLHVAVKDVPKDKVLEYTDESRIPLEVALMQQVSDIPGVIRILDFFDMGQSYYIVMERFNSKDLFDFISEEGPLGEKLGRQLFRQVVDTVITCHSRGVLHRDIKDENILIDLNTHQIKIIDFGSGTYLHEGIYTDFEGTRVYSPPEWIKYRRYRAEGLTVWSLGILLYDMLCGDVPYETDQDIREGDIPWRDDIHLSDQVRDLIQKCLSSDPERRLSLSAVINHPWFMAKDSQGQKFFDTHGQKVLDIQGLKLLNTQEHTNSNTQRQKVSDTQGHRVSGTQGQKVLDIQGNRNLYILDAHCKDSSSPPVAV